MARVTYLRLQPCHSAKIYNVVTPRNRSLRASSISPRLNNSDTKSLDSSLSSPVVVEEVSVVCVSFSTFGHVYQGSQRLIHPPDVHLVVDLKALKGQTIVYSVTESSRCSSPILSPSECHDASRWALSCKSAPAPSCSPHHGTRTGRLSSRGTWAPVKLTKSTRILRIQEGWRKEKEVIRFIRIAHHKL